ncbi:oxysterol-binding protein-related protein 3 isoform X1 [Pundamilia nyererei]|uniref:Oxysterol-binding protein n=2 Tax=Haplochromini TaxID=319058 RepID=A0A9Y3RGS6_9CICH|nr:PREDICTED: oxysterol-binding protein-related protein 3-like isoform X1 [Pundamilia nyererei]XP_005738537.1 PREDICTED: oxysterol-binding protein-related protein 3-like isoform X1 [Pundamilia nyererei]XP_005934831.1 oxysterol-binding protein-related protein 3 isoform X1 [Haplochromis burtoni]XP_039887013.1 oxysterol-binding protein-related protein 3 isoform X1 [Simochromis diagramma]XP_039887014.1 oxysterol-binding protein-related protein 3 isoform X1 [Simochromis diagramma]
MSSEERGSAMSQKISSLSRSNSSSSSKHDSRQDSWEIVEGLRGSFSSVQEPQKQEGYMMKRRKWPMKGWHKRYFFLDKGILKYGKCSADIEKGKLHGCIDVGLSVMAIKKKAKCIDLDAEENIYHLKIKSQELFDEWVSKLRHHRLYRQNEIAMYPNEKSLFYPHYASPNSPGIAEGPPIRKCLSIRRQSTVHHAAAFPLNSNSQAKVAAWLQSSDEMDKCFKDLSVCEAYLLELNHLLQSMEVIHRTYSAPSIQALQASTFDSPKKEKRLPKKWRTKNYNKDVKTTLQVPSCISSGSIRLHASNPNLSTAALSNDKADPESLDSPFDVAKLQEDFCRVATNLHTTMKAALSTLTSERERLKQCLDHETCPPTSPQVVNLKNTLAAALAQNSELRERLCKIHAESQIIEPTLITLTAPVQKQESVDEAHPLVHQVSNESRASIAESLSEFFDAQEVLLSASSSENEVSEDDSYISDISDNISMDNFSNETESERPNSGSVEEGTVLYRRRSCLPTPSPSNTSISLWNILRNNIGKDLSKVAMPVQLNEPLNTLQRLCEELEYSELLDRAANTQDPFERMIYIATFVVSGYASSYYRTGGKPFNPVLGETYECDRPDKGLRFVAEQVSHHPPISACHAESKNFVFWQDVRCKNKFWGKSMEIVPVGTTHVTLPGFGDHYEWNKVTSCIHNILSGQRWIEHYGEITIRNSSSDICQCKITFIKAKYWNSSVNEIEGTITNNKGKVIHRLFGKWHEAVFCGDPPSATCIWRANAMPVDHEQYYGFTKFAIELNELDPSLKLLLPPTDTRLRVDQRLLEEGKLEAAEEHKQRIEQLQRDRRRVLEENNATHQPKFFRKAQDDTWVSNNTYWELRKDPGFAHVDFPTLW